MMESGNKLYRGTYIYNNGDYYAGSFRNNLRADEGKAYFTNGDIYDGNWKEDKMNGLGVYYFGGFSTGEKYDGYWVNNRMEGNGTYTTAQGYIITGIWENNKHKSW